MSHAPINQPINSQGCYTAFRPLGQAFHHNHFSQSATFHHNLPQQQVATASKSVEHASQPSRSSSLEDPVTTPTPRPASGRKSPSRDISQFNQADIDALPRFPSASHALKQQPQKSESHKASEALPAAAATPVTVHSSPPFLVNRVSDQDRSGTAPNAASTSPNRHPRSRHAHSTGATPQPIKVFSTPPLPVNTALGPQEGSTSAACGPSDEDFRATPVTEEAAEQNAAHIPQSNSPAVFGSSAEQPVTVFTVPPMPVNFDRSTGKCCTHNLSRVNNSVSPTSPTSLHAHTPSTPSPALQEQSISHDRSLSTTGIGASHPDVEQSSFSPVQSQSATTSASREPSARSLVSSTSRLAIPSYTSTEPSRSMAASSRVAASGTFSDASALCSAPPTLLLNTQVQSTPTPFSTLQFSPLQSQRTISHSSVHTPSSDTRPAGGASYSSPLPLGNSAAGGMATGTAARPGQALGVCVHTLPPFPINQPSVTGKHADAASQPAATPCMSPTLPSCTSVTPPPTSQRLSRTASASSSCGPIKVHYSPPFTVNSAAIAGADSQQAGAAPQPEKQRDSLSQSPSATSEPPTASSCVHASGESLKVVSVHSSPPFLINMPASRPSTLAQTTPALRSAPLQQALPSSSSLPMHAPGSESFQNPAARAAPAHVYIDPPFPVNAPVQPHTQALQDRTNSEPQSLPQATSICSPSVSSSMASSSSASAVASSVLRRSSSTSAVDQLHAGSNILADASLATGFTLAHGRTSEGAECSRNCMETIQSNYQGQPEMTWQQWRAKQAQGQQSAHSHTFPGYSNKTRCNSSICEIEPAGPASRDTSGRSVSASHNERAVCNNKSVSWGHDTITMYRVPSIVDEGNVLRNGRSYKGGLPVAGRLKPTVQRLHQQAVPHHSGPFPHAAMNSTAYSTRSSAYPAASPASAQLPLQQHSMHSRQLHGQQSSATFAPYGESSFRDASARSASGRSMQCSTERGDLMNIGSLASFQTSKSGASGLLSMSLGSNSPGRLMQVQPATLHGHTSHYPGALNMHGTQKSSGPTTWQNGVTIPPQKPTPCQYASRSVSSFGRDNSMSSGTSISYSQQRVVPGVQQQSQHSMKEPSRGALTEHSNAAVSTPIKQIEVRSPDVCPTAGY